MVDNGRTLEWGKNISPENMTLLRQGEVFTLLDADGQPHKRILMDSYGTIREGPIQPHPDQAQLAAIFFGVPPYNGPSAMSRDGA